MAIPVAHGTAVASMSPRATSALGKAGIETLEVALERAKTAPDDLLKLPGFGAASLVALVTWGCQREGAVLKVPTGTFTPERLGRMPPGPKGGLGDPIELHARELLAVATQANGGRLRPTDADAAWALARRFRALAEGAE